MNAEFWNQRYAPADYAYGREPNDFLRAEAHRIPKGRVLCLAEGEGRNAVLLAALGYDVVAVDQSAEGLRKAALLASERGVLLETVHADLAKFVIEPGQYAGIVSIFAHLPPELRTQVHRAVTRGLAPAGVFLLEAYRPEQPAFNTGGPKDAAWFMTCEGLTKELAPLQMDVVRNAERDVLEGAFHTGRAATVQVVARRV